MQLFSWKTEDKELDQETWKHPALIEAMNLGNEMAKRLCPNQTKVGKTLFYQATGMKTAADYLKTIEEIGTEGINDIQEDYQAYKNALRGDIWWGSHRRHLCTQAHHAAWINAGNNAADKMPESCYEAYSDESLAKLSSINENGRERIQKWERGAILLQNHPGILSDHWEMNKGRNQSGTLQDALIHVIGSPGEQKKSLSTQATQAKKILSRIGEFATMDTDAKKMTWLWAEIEGEPIEETMPGIEKYVEKQLPQRLGELLLRTTLQRSWLRQTIRQESYTLQGVLVESILKHGEKRTEEECPAKSETFKIIMATRIVWDLFCRLETQEILKKK